ncbi:MAG: 50S ribosomal protein L31e [Nanoarchaeota archaeon]|nr:50S ribosomal protein L31e [Nanoarchaeota archaeon]
MTSKKTKKITKQIPQEREYIINLRREISKVPRYKKTPKAIKAIKQFIAKHMRIPERDLKKVKLDKYLNQEIWFRGIQNPLRKIKVKAKRNGEIVNVELSELPAKWKFAKAREDKEKAKSTKAKVAKAKEKTKKTEEKSEEKTAEEKVEESEKEKSSAETKEKSAQVEAKQQKHIAQSQKMPKSSPQRKALKK